MPNTYHSKSIRTLCIIALVLSALAFVVSLACAGILTIFKSDIADELAYEMVFDGQSIYDDDFGYLYDDYDYYRNGGHHDDGLNGGHHVAFENASHMAMYGYGYEYDPYYSYWDSYGAYSEAYDAMIALMNMIIVLLFLSMLGSAVLIVAAIIAIANSSKLEKRGLVFGWTLAGAIVSFLSGQIACAVLFVISAVFASKDKSAYAAQMTAANAGFAYAPTPTPVAPTYTVAVAPQQPAQSPTASQAPELASAPQAAPTYQAPEPAPSSIAQTAAPVVTIPIERSEVTTTIVSTEPAQESTSDQVVAAIIDEPEQPKAIPANPVDPISALGIPTKPDASPDSPNER